MMIENLEKVISRAAKSKKVNKKKEKDSGLKSKYDNVKPLNPKSDLYSITQLFAADLKKLNFKFKQKSNVFIFPVSKPNVDLEMKIFMHTLQLRSVSLNHEYSHIYEGGFNISLEDTKRKVHAIEIIDGSIIGEVRFQSFPEYNMFVGIVVVKNKLMRIVESKYQELSAWYSNTEIKKSLNPQLVKMFSTIVHKKDLIKELEKDEDNRIYLNPFLKIFPDRIPVNFLFKKNDPRNVYVEFKLPIDLLSPKKMGKLYVYPSSVFTVNSWLFLRELIRSVFAANNFPMVVDFFPQKNLTGPNFVVFPGKLDIKSLNRMQRQRLFSSEDHLDKFDMYEYTRMYSPHLLKINIDIGEKLQDRLWKKAVSDADELVKKRKLFKGTEEYVSFIEDRYRLLMSQNRFNKNQIRASVTTIEDNDDVILFLSNPIPVKVSLQTDPHVDVFYDMPKFPSALDFIHNDILFNHHIKKIAETQLQDFDARPFILDRLSRIKMSDKMKNMLKIQDKPKYTYQFFYKELLVTVKHVEKDAYLDSEYKDQLSFNKNILEVKPSLFWVIKLSRPPEYSSDRMKNLINYLKSDGWRLGRYSDNIAIMKKNHLCIEISLGQIKIITV